MTPERAPRAAGLGDLLVACSARRAAGLRLLAARGARRAPRRAAAGVAAVFGLVVAVLLVTAWLALVVAVMMWLLGERISWPAALAIGARLNIAGAGALLWWMRTWSSKNPLPRCCGS